MLEGLARFAMEMLYVFVPAGAGIVADQPSCDLLDAMGAYLRLPTMTGVSPRADVILGAAVFMLTEATNARGGRPD